MFDQLSPGELVAVVEDAHRLESMQMARKLAAVAQLLGLRVEEELAIDEDARSMIAGFARTTAEVSAALNMTAAGARHVVMQAEVLDCRLPRLAALLAAGRVDWATVEVVITRTELVDEEKCVALDAVLADKVGRWRCWSRQGIIDAVDHEVKTIDADAAKQRRVVAFDERGVNVTTGLDGMARVRANMSAQAGAAFDRRLSELAKQVCAKDPRTLKQRRADAVDALVDGVGLACMCESPDCQYREVQSPAPATRAVMNVIAPASTVAGDGQAPGYLAGFGVIDADVVRELATDAVHRQVAQPSVSDCEALRYRPSAALDRWVRCRDLTCRFPGCTVPAVRCDVDHTEPFNHADPATGGLTVPWNLACYCREHHRIKTFGGWCDRQLADGTIVWTSPAGQTYSTSPGGAEVFPELRQSRPRSDRDRKRIAEARKRLAERRPVNEYHRYRNREAAREIDGRQWRNHFRRMRVLFHGETTETKPSKSPFARWVNDPAEPEELPADWQPPPLTTSDPDEPPPF
ncbi:Uncharacterised protein [Mycolicibacterium vanbaalenii]|uniref:DUF222 domain-containing protein n=1 Tax=Mycolicibacterium vanbaalenii TaxID=110539 RepID=A0A5S9NPR1_MYCVN|nr:HNH endonuclease signature motif containing protein [Mycolicibacterium vanbaalenii]CAA0092390.1 Uncharacterised protein [Mycolicibacterium vanbaalenii]